jgi:hypothetical protein
VRLLVYWYALQTSSNNQLVRRCLGEYAPFFHYLIDGCCFFRQPCENGCDVRGVIDGSVIGFVDCCPVVVSRG